MYKSKTTQKCYIGLSSQIEERQKQHLRLSKKENPSKDFYKAVQELGWEDFTFSILEECNKDITREELNEKEEYYIKKYDSYNNGYNMTKGGTNDCNNNRKLKDYDVLEIVDLLKNSSLLMKDIAEMFNTTTSNISLINTGKSWCEITKGPYPFSDSNKFHIKGEKVNTCKSSDAEIMEIRKRYVNETVSEILKDYKDKYSKNGLTKICYGQTHKDLPYYIKRQKQWILNGTCIDYPSEGE